jgi:hypothetical protein
MKILIALFLVGCSNSSADVVPKIPDMACKQVGEVVARFIIFKCEDKDAICYVASNRENIDCIKKESTK